MSSTLKSVLLVGAGTLCGVGGIKACAYFEQRSPRSVAASRERLVEPREGNTRRMTRDELLPRAASAPAPLPSESGAAARAPEGAMDHAPPGRTDDEVHFQVEQRFQHEPPASPAAIVFSRTVEDAFVAKTSAGAHVRGVQCRDVLCQVSLSFDSGDAERGVMSDVLLYGPLRKYASIAAGRSEEGDTVKLTLYVAREGEIPIE